MPETGPNCSAGSPRIALLYEGTRRVTFGESRERRLGFASSDGRKGTDLTDDRVSVIRTQTRL